MNSYLQLFSLPRKLFTPTIYKNTLSYLANGFFGFFGLLQLAQAINSYM